MPFLLILVLIFTLLVAGVGIRRGFAESPNGQKPISQKIAGSSRDKIKGMLKRLERKKAPEEKMGAMCYKVAAPAEYLEYICPLDGEKTVYDRKTGGSAYWVIDQIEELRRLTKQLNLTTNLAKFDLDERRFCHSCFPNLTPEERYVSLVTKYPDGKQFVYDKISPQDLRIMIGFFEQKLSYKDAQDMELSLKKYSGKIKEILGIDK